MLFNEKQEITGIDSFDPTKCRMEAEKKMEFEKDDVAMGCSEGCWDGCIGSCRRFQH